MIKDEKGKDRGEMFKDAVRSSEEGENLETDLDMFNWADLPLYYKKLGGSKISLYRSKATTTSGGTVKSGDFHLYLEDPDHYTYIGLSLEDIAVLKFYLEHTAVFLAGKPTVERELKVYSVTKEIPEPATLIIAVNPDLKAVFLLKNEGRIVKVEIPLNEVVYFLSVLGIVFEEAYKEFTGLRKELWEKIEISDRSSGKEDLMYG